MFEDLIKSVKSQVKILSEKKCPYCGSYVITGADRVFTVDDKWTQSMKCDVCSKLWTLIYNEDQSYSHMSLDEYKRKKK